MAGVLVVEDDDDIRSSIAEVLTDAGFAVETARNGAEALTRLDHGPLPGVMVADLMMPVMTGWELIDRVRANAAYSSMPVVVLSAASERSPPGVDRILSKPCELDTLVQTVRHYCEAGTTVPPEEVRELARRNVELIELQRFRNEMSAMIVHDLKNPMAVIMSMIDYLLGNPSDEEDRVGALEDMKTAGSRILRLIANLLDLTKLETGRFLPQRTSIRLSALVDQLFAGRAQLAVTRQLTLVSTIDPELRASVDVDLICRVIENILDNALRYAPTGGRVCVWAEASEARVRIHLGNDGPAIPPEQHAVIFDKFTQLHGDLGKRNLGLGLYFCRLAVEALGGRISLVDDARLPVVFCLDLPR